jgi:uncharacterized protein (DUF2147 family)
MIGPFSHRSQKESRMNRMVAKIESRPRRTLRGLAFLLPWGALLGSVLFAASGARGGVEATEGAEAAEGAGAAGSAEARDAVYGFWASSGTLIEVRAVGDSLSARIVALKNPNWREKDEQGQVGSPKTDLHNPDAALHQRPLLGLEMLSEYAYRKGKWRGTLYLPANGSRWKSTLRVNNGELLIRGYVGMAVFGKTQTFAPMSSCNDDIQHMIVVAGLTDTPCVGNL